MKTGNDPLLYWTRLSRQPLGLVLATGEICEGGSGVTTQLVPPLRLFVPEKNNTGTAHLVTDYGIDHDRVWTIFMDSGEVWDIPNPRVRAVVNVTAGRINDD